MNKYKDIRELIHDGDTALFRNGGLINRLSDGPYTHAAMCLWLRDKTGLKTELMLAEMREGYGGRIITLSSQVRLYSGNIDIFRPVCRPETAEYAAHLMARMAGHDYGWGSIKLATFKRLTLLRLVTGWKFHTEGTELSPWDEPKHCSQAICWAERAAARKLEPDWEPTSKNDRDCEPNDLCNTEHRIIFPNLVHCLAG